ncbi:MAG: chemotaxis protein CheX [Oceanospirillaceae bacterium]|nr:chemotaxis protein CheX [Oceanospirillaceae bacterium]
MNEKFINVFVDGLVNYFQLLQPLDVEIGTPYLVDNQTPVCHDITGIIGISGKHKGVVYFTAPTAFLAQVAKVQGDQDVSTDNLLDLSGEIANTIAGNARSEFGKQFQISVPLVVEGDPTNLRLPTDVRSYAVPMRCQSMNPVLVVCLERSE